MTFNPGDIVELQTPWGWDSPTGIFQESRLSQHGITRLRLGERRDDGKWWVTPDWPGTALIGTSERGILSDRFLHDSSATPYVPANGDIVEMHIPYGWGNERGGEVPDHESDLSRRGIRRVRLGEYNRMTDEWYIYNADPLNNSMSRRTRGIAESRFIIGPANQEDIAMTTPTTDRIELTPGTPATGSNANLFQVGDIVRFVDDGTVVEDVRGKEGVLTAIPDPNRTTFGHFRVSVPGVPGPGIDRNDWGTVGDNFVFVRRGTDSPLAAEIRVGDRVRYNGTREDWQDRTGVVRSVTTEFATVAADVDGIEHSVRVAKRNLEKLESVDQDQNSSPSWEPAVGDRVVIVGDPRPISAPLSSVGMTGTIIGISDRSRGRACYRVEFSEHVASSRTWNYWGDMIARENDRPIQVGDRVIVTEASDRPSDYEGKIGVVTQVSETPGDGQPYRVEFNRAEQDVPFAHWWVEGVLRVTSQDGGAPVAERSESTETLDEFKRRLVREARIAAKRNNMCTEVDKLLIDNLGLKDYYPTNKKVTVSVVLEGEEAEKFLALKESTDRSRFVEWINNVASPAQIRVATKDIKIEEDPITSIAYGGGL